MCQEMKRMEEWMLPNISQPNLRMIARIFVAVCGCAVPVVCDAAFTPSPDAAWSMVIIPDTQNYVKDTTHEPILTQMTEWIRDHREEWKIQVVLQEGDIVNQNSRVEPTSGNQSATQQWQNAREAFSVLNGHLPYIMATGNHDYGTTSAQDRSTQFNTYFKAGDNSLVDPQQGGILRGTMQVGRLENAYFEFTAPDGREMLIFSLEWGPRQVAVDWANTIASRPEFDEHTAVLVTHAYMYHDETRYDWARNLDAIPGNDQGGNPHSYGTANDTNDGEELWNELVRRHGNFEMVFSGHVGGDGVGKLTSTGDAGNNVHQMLFNTQFEANGGNGWFRVLEFLDDGRSVRVRTYSPFLDTVKSNGANQFTLTLSPFTPHLAGDYSGDGVVGAEDYVLWRDALGETVAPGSGADGDRNGRIEQADYVLWKNNFGRSLVATANSTSVTVPEPSTVVFWMFAALLVAQRTKDAARCTPN